MNNSTFRAYSILQDVSKKGKSILIIDLPQFILSWKRRLSEIVHENLSKFNYGAINHTYDIVREKLDFFFLMNTKQNYNRLFGSYQITINWQIFVLSTRASKKILLLFSVILAILQPFLWRIAEDSILFSMQQFVCRKSMQSQERNLKCRIILYQDNASLQTALQTRNYLKYDTI